MPATYTVGRNPEDARKWAILQDGALIRGRHDFDHPDSYFRTKRDAIARMEARIAREAYEARILAEDETGHIWTDEEAQQIAEYAAHLQKNEPQNSLYGVVVPQDRGRTDHFDEIHTISGHYAWGEPSQWSKVVCAEIRRRRAARVEAFRQAGLVLTSEYYTLTAHRTNHPTKQPEPSVFTHQTREEAEEAKADILSRCEKSGEVYELTVAEVPAAWPFICKFQEGQ